MAASSSQDDATGDVSMDPDDDDDMILAALETGGDLDQTGVDRVKSAIEYNRILHKRHQNEIEQKESVYTFMLFMPPLSRKRYGHFCTPQNGLAFMLFWLNAMVQVSLTFIAGNSILSDHKHWRASLIHDNALKEQVDARVDYLWDHYDTIAKDKRINPIGEINPHIQDSWKKLKEIGGHADTATFFEDKCCIGVECAGLGIQCCRDGGNEGLAMRAPGEKPRRFKRSHVIPESEDPAMDGLVHLISESMGMSKPGGGKKDHSATKTDQHSDEKDGMGLADAPMRSEALCNRVDRSSVECAPPSSSFMDFWHDLDTDNDGFWTVDEARADASNLGCSLGVTVEEMFRSTCRGLEVDFEDSVEHGGRLVETPISIQNRTAVPLSYFIWFEGVVALCSKTDASHCSRLMQEGAFDGAANPNAPNWKGGIRDLDTAMSYCSRMLKPGGHCDELMPGTYTMYQSRVREKCGKPVFALGPRYANPNDDHDVVRTDIVQFKHLADFETTHSGPFRFFLALLLMMWYINLLEEFKDCLNLLDFIWNFPVKNVYPFFPLSAVNLVSKLSKRASGHGHIARRTTSGHLEDSADDAFPEQPELPSRRKSSMEKVVESYDASIEKIAEFMESQIEKEVDETCVTITFISRPHQWTCIGMLVSRLILAGYMAYVGTTFLLSNHSYIDLLLNAVALAFILDVDEYLFICLVSEDTKKELENVHPLRFKSSFPQRWIWGYLCRKQFMGFGVIPVVTMMVVIFYDRRSVKPVLAALQCLCQHTGEQCVESNAFPKEWWDQYWAFTQRIVPGDAFRTH